MVHAVTTLVEGLRNVRDLGGVPCGGGAVVRPMVLFRSEAPVGVGTPGLAALGLRTVIDLRDRTESNQAQVVVPAGVVRVTVEMPRPCSPDGHIYLDQIRAGARRAFTAEELAGLYVRYLDEHAASFGRVLTLVADPTNVPTLFHCTAGKDRTGLVAALLLDLLGADRDAIVADYELTTQCRAYRLEEMRPEFAALGVEVEAVASLFTAPREALQAAFTHLDGRYAGTARYLQEVAGLSADTIGALRRHLLVSDAQGAS